MPFYSNLGISTNDIAGAVALEAIHDMQVNNFAFSGFPSIWAEPFTDGTTTVFITERSNPDISVSFQLGQEDAVAAGKHFQKGERFGGDLFDTVQKKLAELEGICR